MNLPKDFETRMKNMLGSEYEDFKKSFLSEQTSHAMRINPEKEKGCCDCQFVAFEGLVPICTYLGKSLFPDKEVRCDRTCDKFKQSKSK